jgi:hypothetical protein
MNYGMRLRVFFPKEKPVRTVGSQPIVPQRKVIDGIPCTENIRM